MNEEYRTHSLEHVLAVLRHRWWVILVLTLALGGASFAYSKHQRKQYTATASVLFQDAQLSQQASGVQVVNNSPSADPRIMATNVQLLTKQSGVAAATAQKLGHGLTAGKVAGAITVEERGQTNVAEVSATDPNPSLAAAIANEYVRQFIGSQRAQQQASVAQALALVERQIAAMSAQQLAGSTGQALLDRAESLRILGTLQNGGAQLITTATPPASPSSPKLMRNTVLGLIIGLLMGLGVAFLLERLDRRMKNVADLEATYQLPLLAAVPRNKLFTLAPGESRLEDRGDKEVFRLLHAYLRYFNVDREIKAILVASAAPGDGKTTIARNLAEAAQETGTKTLLIEADLRRPAMSRYYELHGPGLSELLTGSATAEQAIHQVPIGGAASGVGNEISLGVLPAGQPPPNPAELLDSNAMSSLIDWATAHYDLVIIDTPPLSVVSDAMSLLRQVDGVVVVSALGKNTRDAATFLRERLVAMNAPLLGVVANGVSAKGEGGYGYGYGYGTYGSEPSANGAGSEHPARQLS